MAEKAFVPVQVRVTRLNNPRLFQHLSQAMGRGESPNAMMRQLAEEALMLREHPILKSAIIELSKLLSNQQLAATTSLTHGDSNTTPGGAVFHTSDTPVSGGSATESPSVATAGSRSMVSALLRTGKA